MDILLNVSDLEISFLKGNKQHTVVHGISFQIAKGRVVGMVGESGSGKSVSALSLMRLLPPSPYCTVSGNIQFFDNKKEMNISSLEEEKMRQMRGGKISMVFQEPMSSLNPVLTCGEQLMETLRIHLKLTKKEAKDRAIILFRKVQLAEPPRILESYPHQLSGGQKQRVMIAMAIACEPDLIIADEPTTALDVTVQKTILKLLKDLQQELGISILFITHDLGVIKEIADEIWVMFEGKIVEKGPSKDIFYHPKHPYTKGLLSSRPPINRQLSRLPTMADFVYRKEGEIQSKDTDISRLLDTLEKKEKKSSAKEETTLLEVKDLVVCFPGKKNFLGKISDWTYAVNNVNFHLGENEILGLAGESGCGKSTLSRAILRLIKVQSGEILYHGENLCAISKKRMKQLRSKMQLIFQDPYSSLNPRLTVGEAILEPMKLHGMYERKERKEKVEELLKKVGLPSGIMNNYPHEFSGGQRQRICIARTLALQPEFIICDESVSALDVSVQAQVLNLLLELKEEFGFSCLFISHDLSVVKFMSDRIMIMNKGKIEEIDSAENIFHHPKSSYTKKLLSAIPQ